MTLVSGLRAASYGIPFQPVAGVFGSDLAKINGWKTVKDPYSGQEVYVIPAIRPDVAVIHVNEVDELGNARVYGTPFWDHPTTRAAKRVLITAERLVPTDVLRLQPELTLVPGFMVEAVSHRPQWRMAGLDASAVRNRLSGRRALYERRTRRARKASRRSTGGPAVCQSMSNPWSPFSYIVVNLARQIRANEITFSGVNSTLPMLACLLAKRAYDFHFTYINVAGGVEPQPTKIPHSSSDPAIVTGSAAIFANQDFYDLCARGGMDLAYLGCAQIDAAGRTNVSVIGSWHDPKVRLPGGGGAAVMLPTAKRVVTWRTEHSPRSLVEKLDFVTAAGNLAALITPIAVFQRRNGRLALESWHPDSSLDAVVKRTGFKFDATGAAPTPAPTQRERDALKALDADGAFEAEAAIKAT